MNISELKRFMLQYNLIFNIFGYLKYTAMNPSLSMDQVFLRKVTEIIEANLGNEKFGAGELSRELGMSRSNINRKLRSLQKNSITQLIQEIRLEKAMEMLQQKVATVSEIAFRVGFSSPTYFNKCFHEYYGFPPGEVKKIEDYRREKAKQMIVPELLSNSQKATPIIKNPGNRKKLTLRIIFPALFLLLVLFFLFYFINETLFKRTTKAEYISITDAEKSIAVLPFKNMSNDPEQEYFSDGMMEEILSHLFMIGGLKIPSSTSTMRFKGTKLSIREIARELGVSFVLEGNVSRAGDNVRIIVRLVNGKNEQVLWTEDYNRAMTAKELHEIQSDVAQQVAENMNVVIKPEVKKRIKARPTDNIEAYTLYLQVRNYHFESYQQAGQMLERAVSLDPGFSDAYALMAFCRMWDRSDDLSREQLLEKVEPLINIALKLDQNSVAAHAVFAEFRLWFYWDHKTVEKEYQIFKRLSPSNTENYNIFIECLWHLGKFREAYDLCVDYYNRDETSEDKWVIMALSYHYIGEQGKAIETIKTALYLFPHNSFIIRHALDIFVETARYDEAIELFMKTIAGNELVDLDEHILESAGIAYFKTGKKSNSNEFLKELLSRTRNISLNDTYVCVASMYLAMGVNDKALTYLEKAYTVREPGLVWVRMDPSFRPLHGDPRFENLLVKIGLK